MSSNFLLSLNNPFISNHYYPFQSITKPIQISVLNRHIYRNRELGYDQIRDEKFIIDGLDYQAETKYYTNSYDKSNYQGKYRGSPFSNGSSTYMNQLKIKHIQAKQLFYEDCQKKKHQLQKIHAYQSQLLQVKLQNPQIFSIVSKQNLQQYRRLKQISKQIRTVQQDRKSLLNIQQNGILNNSSSGFLSYTFNNQNSRTTPFGLIKQHQELQEKVQMNSLKINENMEQNKQKRNQLGLKQVKRPLKKRISQSRFTFNSPVRKFSQMERPSELIFHDETYYLLN